MGPITMLFVAVLYLQDGVFSLLFHVARVQRVKGVLGVTPDDIHVSYNFTRKLADEALRQQVEKFKALEATSLADKVTVRVLDLANMGETDAFAATAQQFNAEPDVDFDTTKGVFSLLGDISHYIRAA